MKLTELQKEIIAGKICPYCKSKTKFVDSSEVYYGKSFGMIYLCKPCEAYVGVHKGTAKALGRLANKSLREAKKKAHYWFDQLWKSPRNTVRDMVRERVRRYKWLSKQLGIPKEYTHIGMFGNETCHRVVVRSKLELGVFHTACDCGGTRTQRYKTDFGKHYQCECGSSVLVPHLNQESLV